MGLRDLLVYVDQNEGSLVLLRLAVVARLRMTLADPAPLAARIRLWKPTKAT
jgi:hypothetical protein